MGLSTAVKTYRGFRQSISQEKEAWSIWTPRDYQEAALQKIRDKNRSILVWHRRAGKDVLALNYILERSEKEKGIYWHVFPTYAQGRKAIWGGIDNNGIKYLDMFKGKKNDTNMSIKMKNGSIYQIIGSDRSIEDLRGANVKGVVLSEFAYMNHLVWRQVFEPMVKSNNGWALFVFTPHGRNHAYDLYEMALKNDRWFVDVKTIEDTKVIFSQRDIKELKEDGTEEDIIQQEYYCDFVSVSSGSYYTKALQKREKEGHIKKGINFISNIPISTYWDIGHNTAIWFCQQQDDMFYVVDYLDGAGLDLEYYLQALNNKSYIYAKHVFPHDMGNREYSASGTRFEHAQKLKQLLGLGGALSVQQKQSLEEGIDTTKRFIYRCKIDSEKCKYGLKALFNYQRAINQKTNGYLDYPEPNQWASHASDAFRYMAIDCMNILACKKNATIPKVMKEDSVLLL